VLLGSPQSNDAAETSETDSASQEQIEKESVGLTPTLARASVGVPISYFKKVWQERNIGQSDQASRTPDPAALDQIRREESEKIQKHVAQLLPRPEDASKAADLVAVTTFQDIPVQEPPAPDFRENLLRWLRQSWEALGMIAVALVSLVVLRSMFRARPAPVEVQSMPLTSDLASEKDGDHAKDIPAPHARRFQDVNSPLREELSELVATDPDAAVSVLRNWIGPIG
jgi:flagellar biosynthesis/type III secretory pathway M-ring protein FliF/YscJ